jgi:hypothetical protein
MDAPHVHTFIRRSADLGGRMGPIALASATGGFLVWLLALNRMPSLGVAGWLLGVLGVLLGLVAALAGAVGLLSDERRRARTGLATGALAVLIPALFALVVLVALSAGWDQG